MAIEQSNKRKHKRAKARKREEQRWAEKSGPVEVRIVDPATLRRDDSPPR